MQLNFIDDDKDKVLAILNFLEDSPFQHYKRSIINAILMKILQKELNRTLFETIYGITRKKETKGLEAKKF